MTKLVKILALLLVIALCAGLFAGCAPTAADTDGSSDVTDVTDKSDNGDKDDDNSDSTENNTDSTDGNEPPADDPAGDAADDPEGDDSVKSIKILLIGNSFSEDVCTYMWQIFNDGGYEEIIIAQLYIGGCTIENHWKQMEGNLPGYSYIKNTNGTPTYTENSKPLFGMQDEDWDIITIQQQSGRSGQYDTYGNLGDIIDYINENKTNPDAKIYFHMTWAYDVGSTHSDFVAYNNDQNTMYTSIVSSAKQAAADHPEIVGIIPTGTTMQNFRSYGDDYKVTRDGYHLGYDVGRYMGALTWYAYFSGSDIADIDWVPSGTGRENKLGNSIKKVMPEIKAAVSAAIANPYEVTVA